MYVRVCIRIVVKKLLSMRKKIHFYFYSEREKENKEGKIVIRGDDLMLKITMNNDNNKYAKYFIEIRENKE